MTGSYTDVHCIEIVHVGNACIYTCIIMHVGKENDLNNIDYTHVHVVYVF